MTRNETGDRARDGGNSLVEVVIGAAILSAVSLAFLGTLSVVSSFHQKDMLSIKGSLLAEEGLEALRWIKAGGWSSLSSLPTGQSRYLAVAPTSWGVTTTPEVVDGIFYRSFRLSQVQRGAGDSIVASGGVVDPNTLLADVSVSWRWHNATTTITYKDYVTSI